MINLLPIAKNTKSIVNITKIKSMLNFRRTITKKRLFKSNHKDFSKGGS